MDFFSFSFFNVPKSLGVDPSDIDKSETHHYTVDGSSANSLHRFVTEQSNAGMDELLIKPQFLWRLFRAIASSITGRQMEAERQRCAGCLRSPPPLEAIWEWAEWTGACEAEVKIHILTLI